MYSKTAFTSAWPILGATAIACTLFAGSVAAEDQEFAVAYRVTTQGLDRPVSPRVRARCICAFGMLRRLSARMACGSTSSP